MSSAGTVYFISFIQYVINDLTKLTASVNGSFGGPLLKNGFLPISSSSSDNTDDSVLCSEKSPMLDQLCHQKNCWFLMRGTDPLGQILPMIASYCVFSSLIGLCLL